MEQSGLVTLEVAANILEVNKQTLRRWDEQGKLTAVRGDNGYRYYDYDKLIKQAPKQKAKPFVKWAGGKTQLLPELIKSVPSSYKNYIEPFLGGGALYFAISPKKAYLNDSNFELISAYRAIKNDPERLIELLEEHKKNHNKDYYYSVRSEKVEDLEPLKLAARFLYLNKTCFNGLFRVNQKGEFNVPIGSYKNPSILDRENLMSCSKSLQNAELFCMDYKDFLLKYANKNDFVYLDPPYLPVSEFSDFDRYSKDQFRIGGQIELATLYKTLVERGTFPILSNSSSPFTEKLYSGFKIDTVLATRSINKNGSKRGKIEECLIKPEMQSKSFFPSTRYMGSKNNLINHILDIVNGLGVKSVFDAFSGSGVVSYHLKKEGYKVISNDFLKYSSSVTKALIENNDVILNAKDIALLLKKNKNSKKFIQTKFKDLYFKDDDNKFLDNLIANIQLIDCEIKKSLALSSISRACLKRRPRGIFTYVGFRYDDGRKDLSYSLKGHFLFSVADFNKAVFDNRKKNLSLNKSSMEVTGVKADLVYLDPPYYSKHSDNDYVRRYHFIEGICRNWEGLEIQENTKTKKFLKFESPFNTKEGTYKAFDEIFKKYKKSKILISYSSNSLPTKDEMIEMLSKYKKTVDVIEIDYKYSFGNQGHKVKSNNNDVKEYLFLGY